jgi:hypothetical protein
MAIEIECKFPPPLVRVSSIPNLAVTMFAMRFASQTRLRGAFGAVIPEIIREPMKLKADGVGGEFHELVELPRPPGPSGSQPR